MSQLLSTYAHLQTTNVCSGKLLSHNVTPTADYWTTNFIVMRATMKATLWPYCGPHRGSIEGHHVGHTVPPSLIKLKHTKDILPSSLGGFF